MLPRPGRPHDQLLRGAVRSVVVAGVGGLLLGHILWLLGITVATDSGSRSTVVLVLSVLFLAAAGYAIHRAWQYYQHQQWTPAAFLGGLAVSPVIFTVIVLGVTYL
jgi:multidrug resistance efflux pump